MTYGASVEERSLGCRVTAGTDETVQKDEGGS